MLCFNHGELCFWKTRKCKQANGSDAGTKIEEHAGSEKARVFTTMDCSDGDIRPTFVNMCVKFGSAEKAQGFQDEFEKAMEVMKEFEGEESEEKKEGDAAADALADQVAETKVGEEEKAE